METQSPTMLIDSLNFSNEYDKVVWSDQAAYTLRDYQKEAVIRMFQHESIGITTQNMAEGPCGGVRAREDRLKSEVPKHDVSRKYHAGVLCLGTGYGKTSIIMSFLNTAISGNFEGAPKRKLIRTNLLFSEKRKTTRINANIVVVPPSLLKQWREEILAARVSSSWTIVTANPRKNRELSELDILTFNNNPDCAFDRPQKNFLMSSSTWTNLATNYQFHLKYHPKRVILDEADADAFNPHIFYADFIWFVSATMGNLIYNLTTTHGAQFSTTSIKGAIKSAFCALDNPNEFALAVSPDLLNKEVFLPKMHASNVFFDSKCTQNFDAIHNVRDYALARNTFDFNNSKLFNSLCRVARHAVSTNLNAKIVVYYYTKGVDTAGASVFAKFAQHFQENFCKTPNSSYHINTLTAMKEVDFAKISQQNGPMCVVLNGNYGTSAGVNMQFATHLVLVGELPMNTCEQMIGRCQRPPRTSALVLYRVLPEECRDLITKSNLDTAPRPDEWSFLQEIFRNENNNTNHGKGQIPYKPSDSYLQFFNTQKYEMNWDLLHENVCEQPAKQKRKRSYPIKKQQAAKKPKVIRLSDFSDDSSDDSDFSDVSDLSDVSNFSDTDSDGEGFNEMKYDALRFC